MRLIDADALKAEINFSVTITGKDNAVEVKRLMELYNKAISNAPTIDAEPVVHCKDCKHRNEKCGMGEHRWCETLNMSTVPNDFCSYGERREP